VKELFSFKIMPLQIVPIPQKTEKAESPEPISSEDTEKPLEQSQPMPSSAKISCTRMREIIFEKSHKK